MILLGIVWIIMGCGVEFGASKPPDGLIFTMIPKQARATIWVVTGAWAIIAAIRSSGTSRALASLMVMPMIRLTSYMWSWVLWLLPGPDQGEYVHGWYQAGFYAVMLGFVSFAAHIPPGLLRTGRSPDHDRGCQ